MRDRAGAFTTWRSPRTADLTLHPTTATVKAGIRQSKRRDRSIAALCRLTNGRLEEARGQRNMKLVYTSHHTVGGDTRALTGLV